MSTHQTHPSHQELRDYLAGKLNAVASDAIEKHLDCCEACCDFLGEVPADDTVVVALREDPGTSVSDDSGEAELSDVTIAVPAEKQTHSPGGDATEFGEAAATIGQLPPELRDHPRYRVVRILGRGGMGDVYKAEHKVMNRTVALKVIKPQLVRNEAAVRRFHREVQAAAQLRHTNIVTAFDAEQAGDLHYLVMEFVDGVDLDEVIRADGRMAVADACDYIRQTAEGLQHAHDLGMVHRDIKPHNLMIEQQVGSISGDATVVKILDFGLANFANETAADEIGDGSETAEAPALHQLTQMGTMMGTPDYIAPEQAQDASTADIRADIYSLGCTFYTLLTGKAPYSGGSVMEKVKAHTQQDAAPLSDFRDDVPAEVESVLRKMMAKDPGDRFQAPIEVARAIQAILSPARPAPEAKPAPPRLGFNRQPAVSPTLLAAAGILLFTLAIVAAGVVFYVKTNQGVVRVEVNDENLYVAVNGRVLNVNDGQKTLSVSPGRNTLVVKQGGFTLETDHFQIRRGETVVFKVELLKDQFVVSRDGSVLAKGKLPPDAGGIGPLAPYDFTLVHTMLGHRNRVEALTISPDRKRILSAGKAWGGSVFLWDLHAGKQQRMLPYRKPDGSPAAACFCANGQMALTTTSGRLVLFAEDGSHQQSVEAHSATSTAIASVPGTSNVVTGGFDGKIFLFDASTGKKLASTDAGRDPPRSDKRHVYGLAVSDDGRYLVAQDRREIVLWDAHTLKPLRTLHTLNGANEPVWTIDFSDDGSQVVVATQREGILLLDVASGKLLRTIAGDNHPDVRILTEGQILEAGYAGTLRLWDATTGNMLAQSKTQENSVLALSPDGQYVVTAGGPVEQKRGADNAVRVWLLPQSVWPVDNKAKQIVHDHKFEFHRGKIEVLNVSPDGRFLLSADARGKLAVWNTQTLKYAGAWQADSFVREARFTSDSKRIVSTGKDRMLRIWDAASGKRLKEYQLSHGSAMDITADDRLAAVAGHGKAATYNLESGELISQFDNGMCLEVRFVASGSHLILASDNHCRRVESATGKEVWSYDLSQDSLEKDIVEFACSPDEQLVAVGGRTNLVLLNANSGEVVHTLKGHRGSVNWLRFTSNGRSLLTGSDDLTVRAWNVATGVETHRAASSTYCLNRGVILPGGKTIVTGGGGGFNPAKKKYDTDHDYSLHIWRLPESIWPDEANTNRLVLVNQLKGHTGPIKTLDYSPGGDLIASGSGWPVGDNTARIWNAKSGELLHTLKHYGKVMSVKFSPDGSLLLTGDDKGFVHTSRVNNGVKACTMKGRTEYREHVSFSPDGKLSLAACGTGIVRVWDANSGNLVSTHNSAGKASLRNVHISPDGKLIFAIDAAHQVSVWNTSDQSPHREFVAAPVDPTGNVKMTLPRNVEYIMTANGDGIVSKWNWRTGEKIWQSQTVVHPANIALTPDERFAVVSGSGKNGNKTLAFVSTEAGKQIEFPSLELKSGQRDARVSPDGRFLVVAGGTRWSRQKSTYATGDNLIRIYQLPEKLHSEPAAAD